MARICDTTQSLLNCAWRAATLRFFRRSDGAISLEYVALGAGVVVAAVIIGVIVMDGLVAPAESIGNQLTVQAP